MGKVRSFIKANQSHGYVPFEVSTGSSFNSAEAGTTYNGSTRVELENYLTYENTFDQTIIKTSHTKGNTQKSTNKIIVEGTTTFSSKVTFGATGTSTFEAGFGDTYTTSGSNSGTTDTSFGSTGVTSSDLAKGEGRSSRGRIGSSEVTSNTFELSRTLMVLDGIKETADGTFIQLLPNYTHTQFTSRTNLTTAESTTWFTETGEGGRVTASSKIKSIFTITDTVTHSLVVFGETEGGAAPLFGVSEVSTEGWGNVSHTFVRDSILIPLVDATDEGMRVFAITEHQNLETGVPRKVSRLGKLIQATFSEQGDSWKGGTTDVTDGKRAVINITQIEEGPSTYTITAGAGIQELTYNTFGSEGFTTTNYSAQSYTVEEERYPDEKFSDRPVSTQVVSTATIPFVFLSEGTFTKTTGTSTVELISTASSRVAEVELAGVVNFDPEQVTGSTDNGDAISVTSAQNEQKFSLGPYFKTTSFRGGVEFLPYNEPTVIGMLSNAWGYFPFYESYTNTDMKVFRTSTYGDSSFDSRYSGDKESMNAIDPPWATISPGVTKLDSTDRCNSFGSFQSTGSESPFTLTSVTSHTTETRAIAGVRVDEDDRIVTTERKSTYTIDTTTTVTVSGSTDVSYSFRWLKPPKDDRKNSSRAYSFIIRNERLEEIRGTRTVILQDPTPLTEGHWTSDTAWGKGFLDGTKQSSPIEMFGSPYVSATVYFRGAALSLTIRDQSNPTKTAYSEIEHGNDAKFGTFEAGGKDFIIESQRMGWRAKGGTPTFTTPLYWSETAGVGGVTGGYPEYVLVEPRT